LTWWKSYAQVIPTSIENHLMAHPAVKDAVVAGIPDDIDGEIPTAFVVRCPSQFHVTSQELIRFVRERVADEERLRGGVYFVDAIPRNDGGKPLRRHLIRDVLHKSQVNRTG